MCFGSYSVNVKDSLRFDIYPWALVVSPSIVSFMPHFSDGECGAISYQTRWRDTLKTNHNKVRACEDKIQFEWSLNLDETHIDLKCT